MVEDAGGAAEDEKKVVRKAGLATARRGRRLTVEATHRLVSDIIEDKSKSESSGILPKAHPAQEMQTPGAVVSVWGSHPEDKDLYAPYFCSKGMNFDGKVSRIAHCLGVLSHRGHKPDQPNQDDFFVLARADSVLLGVLDGHGAEGHDVAHWTQERLPTNIMAGVRKDPESWEASVRTAVKTLCEQSSADSVTKQKVESSGCTLTVLMLDNLSDTKIRMRCAWLGDSIAVVAKRKCKEDSWDVTQVVSIHRPDREDEADRIKKAGGSVIAGEEGEPGRLAADGWSLAISRSFGDFHAASVGLSVEPEFSEMELESDSECFILVCSDGVWDVMSPAQAANLVGKFSPDQAQSAVQKLVSKAQLKWQEQGDTVDDITAVLLWPSFGSGLEAVSEEAETAATD